MAREEFRGQLPVGPWPVAVRWPEAVRSCLARGRWQESAVHCCRRPARGCQRIVGNPVRAVWCGLLPGCME